MTDRASNFEEVALPHLDAVYRTALTICGKITEAEDLTQVTFVKALEKFDTFEPGTNCKAWLLQILRFTWIDQLRQLKSKGTAVQLDETLVAEPVAVSETSWSDAQDLLDNFSDEQVIRALGQLPEEQRLTLYLVDVEQMSHEEVAAIVGCAVGTVKSRSGRARAALKVVLADHAREFGFMKE